MNHPDTNFVKQYKPGSEARVELTTIVNLEEYGLVG